MKTLIILAAMLGLAGCSHIVSKPRFATIYDVHEDPVRVITDEEIARLPSTLSLADVYSRFGRSMRCEIAIGFYPRFIDGVDYSVPLGDRVIGSSFMFLPD